MDNCKHVARLSPPSGDSIIDPKHWLCTVCGTTESVWACLSCSNMACGRFNEEHALQHYKKSKHPLALEVNEKYLYCYECDEYVLNDNEAGDVEMLRQTLSAVARQSFKELASRRKGLLRSHSFAGFEQRGNDTKKLQREDQGYTALKFRRVVLLTKVFQAWYAYAQTSKAARSHRHISKDDLFEASPDSCRRSTRKRKMAIIPGVTGLRNLGNTCYMNSVLQVLSHLQEFRDFFLKFDLSFTKLMHDKPAVKMKLPYQRQTTIECFQEINADGRSTSGVLKGGLNGGGTSHSKARIERLKQGSQCLSLCHELHALLRVMWSGKWALVSPQAILQAIWKIIPFFKGYSQQDAQEFMGEFLDKVQSELETAVPGSSHTHQGSARDIISQTFQGQLVSKVTCLRCGHVSSTFESFMDLPLEFLDGFQVSSEVSSKSCSLKEMLQKFTSAEKLDGPIYACDGCNRNRRKAANKATVLSEAEKIIHIHKLPPVLRLQLKRFVWSGRNNRGKIGAHVGFPRVLDMAAFCDTGTDCESFRYVLSAAVVHHGRGFGSGHYTAYCWNSRADSWVHCNDSRVDLCSLSDVMKCQAYILIYTRCEDFLTLLDASDSYLTLNSLFEQEIDPEVTFNYRNSTIPRFMDLKRRVMQDSDAKPQLKRRRTVT